MESETVISERETEQDHGEIPIITPELEPARIDLSFLDNVPVRLPTISSEELEHVDDEWLDAAYERKLVWSGESLTPIENAAELVDALIGGSLPDVSFSKSEGNNGNGSAVAKAFERPDLIPVFDDAPVEPVILPDNASEEELLAYAQVNPLVRHAMRALRGKIVEIRRRPE